MECTWGIYLAENLTEMSQRCLCILRPIKTTQEFITAITKRQNYFWLNNFNERSKKFRYDENFLILFWY